ncbi:MAG: SRPBCC domain-containing protein [Acidobacteriota bacterium]
MTSTIRSQVMEVGIEADVATVWEALTDGMGSWWPHSFLLGGEASTFHLEPRPGGRVYETWAEDEGAMWGQVTSVKKNERLWIACDYFAGFGGPSRGHLCYELSEDDGVVKVRLTETTVGGTDEKQASSLGEGWNFLLDCMKAHCEGRPAPEWQGGDC